MKFWLYIKSGTDFPDLEEFENFSSKKEAISYWEKRHPNIPKKIIKENIAFEENGKWELI